MPSSVVLPDRQAPHIYSEQEIIDLLAAARQLGPAPGLRGIVLRDVVRPACQYRDADFRGAGADQRRRSTSSRECSPFTWPSSANRARFPCIPAPWKPCAFIAGGVIWPAYPHRTRLPSSSAREVVGRECPWATGKCVASSLSCANGWAGATAAPTMPRASMT